MFEVLSQQQLDGLKANLMDIMVVASKGTFESTRQLFRCCIKGKIDSKLFVNEDDKINTLTNSVFKGDPTTFVFNPGIVGFTWQRIIASNHTGTIGVAFWLSSLLTCGMVIQFVYIGSVVSFAASVVA